MLAIDSGSTDQLTAVSTSAYVVLTAVLVVAAYRQARHAEVAATAQMSERWSRADLDWAMALLVARGPDGYYNIASPLQTEHYRALLQRWSRIETEATLVGGMPDPSYWSIRSAFDNEFRVYEQAAAATVELLSAVSLSVLTGRMSVAGAYTVLGPQLTRNAGSVRRLLPDDRPMAVQDWVQPEVIAARIQGWGKYRPGVVRRVHVLTDLMWAYAVRAGDLAPFEIGGAATAKAAGSGKRNRRRLRQEIERLCPSGTRGIRSWRLRRLLRQAEWRRRFSFVGVQQGKIEVAQKRWLGQ